VRDDIASYESTGDSPEMSKYDKVVRLGTTKSRLFIDCVRPADAGVYTCVAETPTLRIVTTIRLHVDRQGKTPTGSLFQFFCCELEQIVYDLQHD